MPGQKPNAVEQNRAKEAVKMDDRHLAWEEEGMPDSLEWCGVFPFVFFLSHLCRKVLDRDPRERKGPRLKLAWVQGTAHNN